MKLLEPSAPTFDRPRKKAIHEWDTGDRPREKFMSEGADALTPAELLAILVGSGNDREDAVTLMQRSRGRRDPHAATTRRLPRQPETTGQT